VFELLNANKQREANDGGTTELKSFKDLALSVHDVADSAVGLEKTDNLTPADSAADLGTEQDNKVVGSLMPEHVHSKGLPYTATVLKDNIKNSDVHRLDTGSSLGELVPVQVIAVSSIHSSPPMKTPQISSLRATVSVTSESSPRVPPTTPLPSVTSGTEMNSTTSSPLTPMPELIQTESSPSSSAALHEPSRSRAASQLKHSEDDTIEF